MGLSKRRTNGKKLTKKQVGSLVEQTSEILRKVPGLLEAVLTGTIETFEMPKEVYDALVEDYDIFTYGVNEYEELKQFSAMKNLWCRFKDERDHKFFECQTCKTCPVDENDATMGAETSSCTLVTCSNAYHNTPACFKLDKKLHVCVSHTDAEKAPAVVKASEEADAARDKYYKAKDDGASAAKLRKLEDAMLDKLRWARKLIKQAQTGAPEPIAEPVAPQRRAADAGPPSSGTEGSDKRAADAPAPAPRGASRKGASSGSGEAGVESPAKKAPKQRAATSSSGAEPEVDERNERVKRRQEAPLSQSSSKASKSSQDRPAARAPPARTDFDRERDYIKALETAAALARRVKARLMAEWTRMKTESRRINEDADRIRADANAFDVDIATFEELIRAAAEREKLKRRREDGDEDGGDDEAPSAKRVRVE